MRNFRLRTKFLLSLVAVSAGLIATTLLVVRDSVRTQVRRGIVMDLQTSLNAYRAFDRQRQESVTRSAQLLANLPNVRALMTTRDAPTVQDGMQGIANISGSDLLVLADRDGSVLGMEAKSGGLERDGAQDLFRRSLEHGNSRDWWFGGGHLYEVWLQPIYLGDPALNETLGYLALGYEVNEHSADDLSHITSSTVAFRLGDRLIATTVPAAQQNELRGQLTPSASPATATPVEIQLGTERYLASTINLPPGNGTWVSLSVLKSFDKATAFLDALNRTLIGFGVLSVLCGTLLVFLISDTFTRPLAALVAGVRALERGDFDYPLESSGGDEVAEVTGAFDRMRVNLRKTQEEQRQLEDRLRQAHKMEAVGRLAGGVAHDFNNLLTIISGHSDLLLERPEPGENERRSLTQIQKAATRATSMTRQLLAFSRMQILQPRVLDLNAIVADLGKMLPRLIGEHIEYSFHPGEVGPIKADPGQIEQVVMNLAVNARDAMPEGGKLIVRTSNVVLTEAETANRPPMTPGPFVLLSVEDTGTGMNEETKAHIFEPFFTTKEVGKGTGLGLATVYGVVKQSGGFVWVESTPGEGATFEIYLPHAVGARAEAEGEAKPRSVPRGSETILVAEDEEGVRELACRFLRSAGYTVLEANNGVEAMEIAARYSGKIHLVLSDMIMPRMSGVALAQELRKARPETKVLLMSGYAEYSGKPGTEERSIPTLQKPFTVHSLVEMVRATLSGETPPRSGAAEQREPAVSR